MEIQTIERIELVSSYTTLGIAVLGLIANVFSAVVMSKVQKTVSGVRLVKYLTVVDIFVLLFLCVPYIYYVFKVSSRHTYIQYIPFLTFPIGYTVHMFEVYLTVLIAVQRTFAVAKPLVFRIYMRDSIINRVLTGIAVISVLFNSPVWLYYWPEYTMLNVGTVTIFFPIYRIVFLIFIDCIPMIVLIVCNVILIISRHRTSTIASCRGRTDNQLTTIVTAVTVVSCVVHCLNFVMSLTMIVQKYGIIETLLSFMVWNTLVCINSSVNCIFYCAFGRQFRQTLKEMFTRDGTSSQRSQQDRIELEERQAQGPQSQNGPTEEGQDL